MPALPNSDTDSVPDVDTPPEFEAQSKLHEHSAECDVGDQSGSDKPANLVSESASESEAAAQTEVCSHAACFHEYNQDPCRI